MTYSSQNGVQIAAGGAANLLSLTDQDGTGVVNLVVLAKFQARADSTINGYLRLKYTTPLASPTEEVQDCAAELTAYYLREAKQQLTVRSPRPHRRCPRARTAAAIAAAPTTAA